MENPFAVSKTEADLIAESAARARMEAFDDEHGMAAMRLKVRIAELKRELKKAEKELAAISPLSMLGDKMRRDLERLVHGSREFLAANGERGEVSLSTARQFESLGLATKVKDGRQSRQYSRGKSTYRLTDKAYIVTGRPMPEEMVQV